MSIEIMSSSELINKIKKALILEENAQFTDLIGQKESFSKFMQRSFKSLHSEHKMTIAADLSKKYKLYPSMTLLDRMDTVKTTRKIIIDLNFSQIESIGETKKKSTGTIRKTEIWETDIKWAPGVGQIVAKTINKLGIITIQDLIHYWPRQHLNFSQKVQIKDLKVGMEATVVGIISRVNAFQSPRNPKLSILNIRITDQTGSLSLNKFMAGKSNKFLLEQYKKQYPVGALVMVSGRAQFDKQTRYQLTNFSLEVIDEPDDKEQASLKEASTTDSLEVGRLVPVYGLTEGLNQGRLRKIIFNALQRFDSEIQETLPENLIKENSFMSFKEAILQMHFPNSEEALERAKERIIFEEFLLMQLPLAIRRFQSAKTKLNNGKKRELKISPDGPVQALLQSLPFKLTGAQKRVFNEIMADLSNTNPMNRLVQGDVGSGKTIVALLTMLVAVEQGQQAALMAPTEILAEQHFRKFQELLTEIGIKVALLIGSQRAAERRDVLTGLANGQIQIVVGTHALIQDSVQFANLGLAVIDEQHRFGVKQRDILRRKSTAEIIESSGQITEKETNQAATMEVKPVDCLFMTATPIPRTLALAMYGNLDLSEIDELPPGRKPIKTKIIPAGNRSAAHEFVKKQLLEGRQAYIVYPLIEESESLSAKAVTEEAIKLEKIYRDFKVGIIHGKLSPEEKEKVMGSFRRNETHILIGTTVIEVGVDVPNATIMLIENAERFGLAQLHQLRGRVGRGSNQSYCFLFGDTRSANTLERLKVMEETENGFVIAQKDLQIRGPGELMGTRQSGLSDFGLASLASHGDLLEKARQSAQTLVNEDPELSKIPFALKKRLEILEKKASLIESG